MIFSYLRRSLSRTKKRTMLIMIGIIVSMTLISGVNIASNQMARYLIKDRFDSVKVDFRLQSLDHNNTANLERLDSLNQEFGGGLTSYVVGRLNWRSSLFLDNITLSQMNWSAFLAHNNSAQRGQCYNDTEICGLGDNIFLDREIRNRFSDTLFVPPNFDLHSPGLYINSEFANKFGLQANDTFSIQYVYTEFGLDNVTNNFIEYAHHLELTDIPVLGVVNILDMDKFGELLGIQSPHFQQDTHFFIGNLTYITNLGKDLKKAAEEVTIFPIEDDISYANGVEYRFAPKITYGLMLNHDALVDISPSQLNSRVDYMRTRIILAGDGSTGRATPPSVLLPRVRVLHMLMGMGLCVI